MITSTFLAVLLVPVFFVAFQRFSEWRKARKRAPRRQWSGRTSM